MNCDCGDIFCIRGRKCGRFQEVMSRMPKPTLNFEGLEKTYNELSKGSGQSPLVLFVCCHCGNSHQITPYTHNLCDEALKNIKEKQIRSGK